MKDVSGCDVAYMKPNGICQAASNQAAQRLGFYGSGEHVARMTLAYLCPLPFLELIELQTHWKMATQGEVFVHTVHCILCTGVLIICSSWFIKDHHKSGHKHNLLQISGCCYKLLDDVFRSQPKFSGPQNIWNMSRRQSVGMADMEDVASHQVEQKHREGVSKSQRS